MIQVIALIVFTVLGVWLLVAPDRHFRSGSRGLRLVGAAACFVSVAANAADMLGA